MNKFIEDTYLFNKLGGCSREQTSENLSGGISLISEELVELCDSFNKFKGEGKVWSEDNRADYLDAIADILVTTIGAAYRAGFNRHQIEVAMNVVAEANLNKFCTNMDDAYASISQYDGDIRYENVHAETIDVDGETYYAIIGTVRKTGVRKILKGINWEDPKNKLKEIV